MNTETINKLVEKRLEEEEFQDCFLVETTIHNKKVEVFLDSDENVSFALCRKMSRHLEGIFDAEKWFGESYTLEVSSAGVGRPLQQLRQYLKNVGRMIEIDKSDGSKVAGRMNVANEQEIHVVWEEKEKVGKKNVKVEKKDIIKYEDISKAKIKISFK